MKVQKRKYIRDGRSPIPESELTSKIMSAIKSKNTRPELLFRMYLWNAGIKGYRLHLKAVPGKPDISFLGKRIAVFINGCFWHRCPKCNFKIPKSHSKYWIEKFTKNVNRDKLKIQQLHKDGWRTLIVWDCELRKNLGQYLKKIEELLKQV